MLPSVDNLQRSALVLNSNFARIVLLLSLFENVKPENLFRCEIFFDII